MRIFKLFMFCQHPVRFMHGIEDTMSSRTSSSPDIEEILVLVRVSYICRQRIVFPDYLGYAGLGLQLREVMATLSPWRVDHISSLSVALVARTLLGRLSLSRMIGDAFNRRLQPLWFGQWIISVYMMRPDCEYYIIQCQIIYSTVSSRYRFNHLSHQKLKSSKINSFSDNHSINCFLIGVPVQR